jgi:superfamily I DNA/RNA helicase
MSSFKPSDEQQNIGTKVVISNMNILVDAKAGTGKTTTAKYIFGLIPNKTVLYMAFNKDIATESKEKMAHMKHVSVKTVHAAGMGMLRKAYKFEGDPNPQKYKKIIRDLSKSWEYDKEDNEYLDRVEKLTDLLRLYFVEQKAQAMHVASKYDILVINGEIDRAFEAINVGRNIVSDIDFTDMIYLPLYHKLKPWQFDVVCIDEAQDLNTCQRMMALLHKKNTGRMIFLGDKRQAIYGFSGADAHAFDRLARLPNTVTLPLTENYRCGKAIIKYAQEIVPEIRAWEKSPEGEVKLDCSVNDILPGDMVLCRYNMPLAKLCMDYLTRGIKAYIRGKEIGEGLARLIMKSKKSTMDAAITWLEDDLIRIGNKMAAKARLELEDIQKTAEYQQLQDKIDAIRILTKGANTAEEGATKIRAIFTDDKVNITITGNGRATTAELINEYNALSTHKQKLVVSGPNTNIITDTDDVQLLNKVLGMGQIITFTVKNPGIMLSTIHKSKGLENKRVYVICPWLSPAGFAKSEEDLVQEENLVYVARTRAIEFFGECIDFDPYAKDQDSKRQK